MLSGVWDAKTARILFTLLVFVVVLGFLRGARGTLTLFLFAILFAYFIEPLVSLLQRLLRGRIRGIIATYLVLGGVFALLAVLFGPKIADEAKALLSSMPALADRVASGQLILNLGHTRGWSQQRVHEIQHLFMSHRVAILGYAEKFAGSLEAPLTRIWWLILIPILSVFFLKDARAMALDMVQLGGSTRQRSVLRGIVSDVNLMLGSYIRAQLILAALTTVVLTSVLGLMRAPFAFILGPIAGLCEFLPVVGPAVACAGIFGIALLTGYTHLLWIFLFLGTWRTVQDYVNAPRIVGKSLEISPLAEIFGVLAGGEIGGVVGALIAVPVLAMLRILWLRLQILASPDTPITSETQSTLQ